MRWVVQWSEDLEEWDLFSNADPKTMEWAGYETPFAEMECMQCGSMGLQGLHFGELLPDVTYDGYPDPRPGMGRPQDTQLFCHNCRAKHSNILMVAIDPHVTPDQAMGQIRGPHALDRDALDGVYDLA